MYDLTSLLTTIAGCSATIVAIIGGFIASRLIALNIEHNEIISRIYEIDEEFSFKLSRGDTSSVEWLKIQKKQLVIRKNALETQKGMKGSIIIFALFSLVDIVIPLVFTPFITECYKYYVTIKICVITIFTISLLAIFIYFIILTKWKPEIVDKK